MTTLQDLLNQWVDLCMEYFERTRLDSGYERREPPANEAIGNMPYDMLVTRMLDIEMQIYAMNKEKSHAK